MIYFYSCCFHIEVTVIEIPHNCDNHGENGFLSDG